MAHQGGTEMHLHPLPPRGLSQESEPSVAYAPDGKTLTSGSQDTTITLWDSEGNEKATLAGHAQAVNSLAFGPDGKTLASSGSTDKIIKLRDVATGSELHTIQGGGKTFLVAFSPEGMTLASTSDDKTIKLWNVQDLKYPG